jgi:hypothetical protein
MKSYEDLDAAAEKLKLIESERATIGCLINKNNLPRDFKVHPNASSDYLKLWDEMNA